MSKLIVALDYDDSMEAFTIATSLHGTPGIEWLKVGLELFTRDGPKVVQTLRGMGFKIMLDLKMFDIPNTVQGGVHSACGLGVDLITVHLLGGERMVKAAIVEAKKAKTPPLVFGITILTSMEDGELPGYSGSLSELAGDLAGKAQAWGLDGVVCSGQELTNIKGKYPNLQCLTPGIRLSSGSADDQKRIMSPEEASSLGSDFLVVGRPITKAADPLHVAKDIVSRISS